MVRLIYASVFPYSISPDDIRKILRTSRKNNPAKGITGILFYDLDYFVQCLEGPDLEVTSLYSLILDDSRHHDVTLLDYCEADKRLFEGWDMAYFASHDLNVNDLKPFMAAGSFNPLNLNSRDANSFIEMLAKKFEGLLTVE